MKKSEMVHKIAHFLYENTGQFRLGNVGLELSLCQKIAPLILNFIEKDGMLPPEIKIQNPGHFLGDAFIYCSNEWEPEDE